MPETIYAANGMGLGDVWASVNYVLNKSIENNKTIKMSTFYIKNNIKKRDYKKKIKEIYPLLKSEGSIDIVDEIPTNKLTWKESFKCEYFPTKPRWRKPRSKNIVYQFDGRTHKGKNCSEEEEKEIINFISKNNYTPIRLGSHLSLSEIVSICSSSYCFVGVDSGFMHMCHSIGIPRFLIRNKRKIKEIEDIHWNKEYVMCNNYLDFMDKFKCRVL
jgi:hypothetical protein